MIGRTVALAAVLVAALAASAHAHGGAYQPPPGDRPGSSGPTTGGGGPSGPAGPTTPGGTAPAPTPPAPTPPAPPDTGTTPDGATGRAPPGAPRGGVGLRVVDFNSVDWARWWFANRLHLLDLRARVAEQAVGPITPSVGRRKPGDELWRAQVQAALHRALAERNRSVASGAAIALGKSADPSEAEALLRVLMDPDRHASVREAAALGLGLLPNRDDGARLVGRTLAAFVTDTRQDERLRAMCVYALGLREDVSAVPVLLATADGAGKTWDLPAAGVAALGLTRCELTIPDLIEMLQGPRRRKKREAVRRAYAAQALAHIGDPVSLPVLRKVALDSEDHARRAAILALGSIADSDDEETIDVLVHVLHRSKDDASSCMAALSIGRIGGSRARRALTWAYEKGNIRVRPFGAIGLGLLSRHAGQQEAVRSLLDDLDHRRNARLRASICVGVALARDPKAAPILREIVADKSHPGLRAHAAFALGMCGDRERDAPTLRSVLEDTRDPDLQRETALALGLLGDREALRILIDVVRDGTSSHAQGSAAVAVGRIGGRESAEALIALLDDDDATTRARAMAAVGLGMLLDRTQGHGLAPIGADLSWYVFTPTVLEVLSIH